MDAPQADGFDIAEYLARRRREERQNAFDLLWENIEGRSWNVLRRHSGASITDLEKIRTQVDHFFPVLAQLFILTGQTIQMMTDQRVREILQYGASRRLGSIRLAVERIIDLAPPDRRKRLSVDEKNELADSILLLYVHMVGVLDAFAIALFRKLELDSSIKEQNADLLNKKFRRLVSLGSVDKLFNDHDAWLRRVKDELRNRFVHRIPPYVPDAAFTEAEAACFGRLEAEKFALIAKGDLDGAERLRSEQDALGVFQPILTFSENNSHMLLHPTILDDTFRFACFVFDLLEMTLPVFERDLE